MNGAFAHLKLKGERRQNVPIDASQATGGPAVGGPVHNRDAFVDRPAPQPSEEAHRRTSKGRDVTELSVYCADMEMLGKALESMVAVVDPRGEAEMAAEHVPNGARKPGGIFGAVEVGSVRRSEPNERTDLETVPAALGLCHGDGDWECEEAADGNQ